MELKSLINSLSTQPKTAAAPAEQPVEKAAQAESTVDARMREVIASATREKVAASGETLQGLLSKEAQAFSDANDEAAVRRAKLAGVAFAESAVSVFDRAGQAADAVIKEAAANMDPEFVELVKMAQHDPGRFLAEVQAGYNDGVNQKLAQYDAVVHDWATTHYVAGYDSMRQALKG